MKLKRLLKFLITAAVLQGLMLLFCTEAGLMTLYPLFVRMGDEEYQTRGAYTVYYDMRLPLTGADCIAVGVDFDVTQSYEAFIHLFRFVKQYSNVKNIQIDHPLAAELGERLAAGESDTPTFETDTLPPVLSDFADTLASVNHTQPPVKKFAITAYTESLADFGRTDVTEGEVALVLLDRDRMMEMYPTLRENGVLCVEMKYVNCPTAEGVRNDLALPFVGDETRISFMPASRIGWFYTYYRSVTNFFGLPAMEAAAERLDNMAAEFVICIANGTLAGK